MKKSKKSGTVHDIEVTGTGIVTLRGVTLFGIEWLKEHVVGEETQGTAEDGIACEPRYAHEICLGAKRDGLAVFGLNAADEWVEVQDAR